MIVMARVGARRSPKQRLAVRKIDSAPLVSDLRNWFETARLPGRSPTAEAISYAVHRPGISRYAVSAIWPIVARPSTMADRTPGTGGTISKSDRTCPWFLAGFRCLGGAPDGAAGKCEGSRLYDVHGMAPSEGSWPTDERAAPITARSRLVRVSQRARGVLQAIRNPPGGGVSLR